MDSIIAVESIVDIHERGLDMIILNVLYLASIAKIYLLHKKDQRTSP